MVDAEQFRSYVVRPALEIIGLWSGAAENLVMGTAAVESDLSFLHQVGGGPARSFFQMEPFSENDLWANYLTYNPNLKFKITQLLVNKSIVPPKGDQIIWNLYYATAMCRLQYYRRPEPLPRAENTVGLAQYWKLHYNTADGAGTVDKFLEKYEMVA